MPEVFLYSHCDDIGNVCTIERGRLDGKIGMSVQCDPLNI